MSLRIQHEFHPVMRPVRSYTTDTDITEMVTRGKVVIRVSNSDRAGSIPSWAPGVIFHFRVILYSPLVLATQL